MILLDYKDKKPIYEQVIQKLQDLIMGGVLAKDEPLPSVRTLATQLSINPNTIQRAYAELERNGWIYSVKGKGSFVAAGDTVRKERRAEWYARLGELLQEAGLLGISREEICEAVRRSGTAEKKGEQNE